MKYILIPIGRFIYVLLRIFIEYPMTYFFYLLILLWTFEYRKVINEIKEIVFLEENIYAREVDGKYCVYKTPWDYLLNKKTWIENKKEEES